MGPIGFKELLIILVIALLIFGGKKLKSLGSDLGSAVKGFKKAMNDATREINDVKSEVESTINTEAEPKKLASSNPTPPSTSPAKDS